MTSLQIYDYTEGELGSLLAHQSFSYSVEHPDRLTIFNGTSISYNSIGCPTTFNRYNTTWSRGKLTGLTKGKMTTGTYSYSYTYNALGQRTQRSFNYFRGTQNSQIVIGETKREIRTYTYDQSGRLIEEGISNEYYDEPGTSETLVYLYDERGIVGVNHTSSGETNTYYYQRNLFGDVIGIYDVNSNCVARYVYDAWGNCSMTHSTKSIATRNPFRYRGYYYDQDTGLYYLNSRYYYPEWRRFISPDDTSYLDSETPNGLNLYTYCNNDPVNHYDPTGNLTLDVILDCYFVANSLTDFLENPTLKNLAWAALDLLCLFLPVATGAGTIITKVDDIKDISAFLSKHDEVIVLGQSMNRRIIPYANKIGATIYKGLDNLDDIKKTYGNVFGLLVGYSDNMAFIIKKSLSGAKYIDYGYDANRTLKGLRGMKWFEEFFSIITIESEKIFAQLFRKKYFYRYFLHKLFKR